MAKQKEDIDKMMIDAMLERPITFTLNKRYFYLYQPSLGISLLAQDIFGILHISPQLLSVNSQFELLRICSEQRNEVLRLIAIHTFKQRSDALYEEKVCKRIKQLQGLDIAEMSVILLHLYNSGTYQEKFIKHIGLEQEKRQRERIQEIKKDRSTITFGGRSLFGSLLDYAAERYGWSLEYILWGVSAINLRMMLQDSVQSVYLTDKERKKLGISTDGVYINADSKEGKQQYIEYLKRKKK